MNDARGEIELKVTGDGSHTLYIPSMKENYHSWHGAHTESIYVFIEQGLNKAKQNFEEVRILEVGMGTGLNAILTLGEIINGNAPLIHYTTIEKFPLSTNLISQLNYEKMLPAEVQPYFSQLHDSEWEKEKEIVAGFTLLKREGGLLDVKLNNNYNLVYFDAFGPEKQPEMWEDEVFRHIYNSLVPGGILVTYCAKGSFKRSLKASGFEVETLPGPPGKREMTRAIKP